MSLSLCGGKIFYFVFSLQCLNKMSICKMKFNLRLNLYAHKNNFESLDTHKF